MLRKDNNRIVLRNVSKTYGKTKVISIVEFTIPLGGITTIIGWSGTGKSTLLNIIGGLDFPDTVHESNKKKPEIDIEIDKYLFYLRYKYDKVKIIEHLKKTGEEKEIDITAYRRKVFSYIFQQHYLHPNLDLNKNINTPHFINSKHIENSCMEKVCKKLRMEKKLNSFATEMSGGEAQRGAILRGAMKVAPILISDEPTNNLDANSSTIFLKSLKNTVDNGKYENFDAALIVSHDLHLVCKFTDDIILIKREERDGYGKLKLLSKDNEKLLDKETGNFNPEKILNLLDELGTIALKDDNKSEEYNRGIYTDCLIDFQKNELSKTDNFKYTWSYAWNDLFKKIFFPRIDLLVVSISIMLITLFILSFMKIGFGTKRLLEKKLSDPRINFIEVNSSGREELSKSHIGIIKNKIGNKIKYIQPIYNVPIRIKKMNKNYYSTNFNAMTFSKNSLIVGEVIGDKTKPFITAEEKYEGIIIERKFASKLGYNDNFSEIDIKFAGFNDNDEKIIKIPLLIVEGPLPDRYKMMMREEFYLKYYDRGTNSVLPEIAYIALYPKTIYDASNIIKILRATDVFSVYDAFKIQNKLKVISQMEDLMSLFMKLALTAITILSTSYIFITISKNFHKKKSEMGVLKAFGMRNSTFIAFYFIESMIIYVLSVGLSYFLFFKLGVEPIINNRLIKSDIVKIFGNIDIDATIKASSLALPGEYLFILFSVIFLAILTIFIISMFWYVRRKPIDLIKGG